MDKTQKRLFDNKYSRNTINATLINRSWQTTPITVDIIKQVDLFYRLDLNDALILDIGCGGTPQCYIFAPDSTSDIIGLDFSHAGLKVAQQHAEQLAYPGTFTPVCGDALNLPFHNEIFDVVMCSMVLEHMENPQRAIGEMARVLKTNGQLFLATVNQNYVLRGIYKHIVFRSYDTFFGHTDERLLTMNQLKKWSEKHGLAIKEELYIYRFESTIWDVFIIPNLIKLGLANNKIIYQILRIVRTLISKFALIDKILKLFGNSACIALVAKKAP
ncbi:class I SAM-dependent methyltransferase [Chloroflexota bacterium]